MYQAHGWWFPDSDQHFRMMLDKQVRRGLPPEYQAPVRRRSIELAPRRGVALDVGANVGLWARDLCASFQRVMAFEPVPEFIHCLRRNVTAANLEIQAVALGAETTTVNMIITENNTGHTHVDIASLGHGQTPMIRLDDLDLRGVDYIKIDCEGYENQILQGARETIQRERPVIVIEDKAHQDVGHQDTQSAMTTLMSWGARVLHTVNRDHVLGW